MPYLLLVLTTLFWSGNFVVSRGMHAALPPLALSFWRWAVACLILCLFGLHHIGAFPVDTWIKKILLREYAPKSRCTSNIPESRLCEALIEENFSKYPGFAGVLQQYIFFYEREFSSKAAQTANV